MHGFICSLSVDEREIHLLRFPSGIRREIVRTLACFDISLSQYQIPFNDSFSLAIHNRITLHAMFLGQESFVFVCQRSIIDVFFCSVCDKRVHPSFSLIFFCLVHIAGSHMIGGQKRALRGREILGTLTHRGLGLFCLRVFRSANMAKIPYFGKRGISKQPWVVCFVSLSSGKFGNL